MAFVSIPISMGYAQIAGLPVVYGLYGSLLPILIYGVLTTSRQFVVGVDAMPAAMVGSLLAQMEIAAESREALRLVPFMTLLVAAWFMVLYFFKAGRIVKYISTPVMGGFISGVGLTIILMQLPKLFGGNPQAGELIALLQNIWEQRGSFHPLSFSLGFGTVAIILIFKKWVPKVPMTVVMMAVGALLQGLFHLDQYGVKMMTPVQAGLPKILLPELETFSLIAGHVPDLLMHSLGIAAVIMAQTLLASGNYAKKYKDEFNPNAELIAYGAMNFAGALVGACPINGSVSRSGIADSMGVRSQVMSVTAAVTMLFVLLFGTPFLGYLPVPILTGIVITALIGILEIKLAKKLWKIGKNELVVFLTAFFGVLFFGTLYGVIIGVLLSFGEVAMKTVMPPTAFVGRIPGHGNFYSLKRNSAAKPIRNTVIYRFSGNLFFANVELFCSEIEGAISSNTHQVVVDARGIGNIDSCATERIVELYHSLRERGILFYLTEHDGSLNDQLRVLGGEILINEGAVRRTITLALRDAGLEKPYDLEETDSNSEGEDILSEGESSEAVKEIKDCEKNDGRDKNTTNNNGIEAVERLSEFEWVFGADAEKKMDELATSMAERFALSGFDEQKVEDELLDEEGVRTTWGLLGRFDEDEFWDFMEIQLAKMADDGRITPELASRVEHHIEKRREFGKKKSEELNPYAAKMLSRHGEVIRNYMKQNHPREYQKYLEMHKMKK